MKNKIKLGVNIDHAATLRQVRGGTTKYPDLLKLASLVLKSGGDQITIHLREDRRHIQDQDVKTLCNSLREKINLEMAYRSEMLLIALKYKPKWVCLVPENRKELTTEGGLDLFKLKNAKGFFLKLKNKKINISVFIEPDLNQIQQAFELGAQAVELHTGAWVLAAGSKKKKLWKDLEKSATRAHELGLYVHAGHGLDYEHSRVIKRLPYLREVNIGHSIICYSVFDGMKNVLKNFRKIFNSP